MKRLTKDAAKKYLTTLLTEMGYRPCKVPVQEQPTLTHCKIQIGSGGTAEIGFEWFKNKMVFFAHIEVPRLLCDMEKTLLLLTNLLARDEKIEVYFNGNLDDDMQNGLRYDSDHNAIASLSKMGAEYIITQEIKVMQGKGKWSYLDRNKKTDYAYLYQQI